MLQLDAVKYEMPEIRKTLEEVGDSLDLAGMRARLDELNARIAEADFWNDQKTAQKVLELTDHFVRKDHLTAFMVTHNMRHAIHYGNRLIMMMKGEIIYDVRGEEKKNLKVEDLLAKFGAAGELNDRMMLG